MVSSIRARAASRVARTRSSAERVVVDLRETKNVRFEGKLGTLV